MGDVEPEGKRGIFAFREWEQEGIHGMSTASNAAGVRSRVGQKSAPGFMFCFIWRLMQAEAVVGTGETWTKQDKNLCPVMLTFHFTGALSFR